MKVTRRGPRHRVRGAAACTAAAAALLAAPGTAAAEELPAAIPVDGPCPSLLILGVQGTGQSAPGADVRADTGMLGQVLGPTVAEHPDVVRAYVPYDAGFGGAIGTGPGQRPFTDSVTQAHARLEQMAADALARCPGLSLGVAGYSQGAQAVSMFAHDIATGDSAVAPDRVAGVALLSNPSKNPGPDPLPGRPGQHGPDPAPGATGAATTNIFLPSVPAEGGIAGAGVDYGPLSGRVAEFCVPADLACDAPARTAALRTAAGLAAQADLHDPFTAATTLGQAWAQTSAEATARVVLDDIVVEDGRVDYIPRQSVSERFADAAYPGSTVGPDTDRAVADKTNTIAAAIAADPIGQIPRLLTEVAGAVGQILADNAGLADPGVIGRFLTAPTQHTAYGPDGQTRQVVDWFGALAHDLPTP